MKKISFVSTSIAPNLALVEFRTSQNFALAEEDWAGCNNKIMLLPIFIDLGDEEDKFCLHHNCPKGGFGHNGLGHDIAIFWITKLPLTVC